MFFKINSYKFYGYVEMKKITKTIRINVYSGVESFQDKLKADGRYRIPIEEYYKIAEESGVSKEQLQQLESNNNVVRIPRVKKFVFVQPEKVTEELRDVLDPTGELTKQKIENNHKTLQELFKLKKKLEKQKTTIEEKAERSTVRTLWGLATTGVLNGVLIARLTWWDLSWDIMEPVTYLLTFGSSIVILAYFQASGLDFSYSVLRKRMYNKRLDKFIRKHQFSKEEYEKLLERINHTQQELIILGEDPSCIPGFPQDSPNLHLKE